MAEGVGFEPTVGFPTLDFESSALNRTQPPFLLKKKNVERSTSNIQLRSIRQRASNANLHLEADDLVRVANIFGVEFQAIGLFQDDPVCFVGMEGFGAHSSLRCEAASGPEKCYNLGLAICILGTAYCMSAGEPRYYLLLTAIHSLLAPLFTNIPT